MPRLSDLGREEVERESERESIGEIRGCCQLVVNVPGGWALSPTALWAVVNGVALPTQGLSSIGLTNVDLEGSSEISRVDLGQIVVP